MRTIIFAMAVIGTVGFVGTQAIGDQAGGGVYTPWVAYQNGDANADGTVDITDVIRLVDWLYRGGPAPRPMFCEPSARFDNGDLNGDTQIDLTDLVFLVNHLYSGGPAPVEACPQSSE